MWHWLNLHIKRNAICSVGPIRKAAPYHYCPRFKIHHGFWHMNAKFPSVVIFKHRSNGNWTRTKCKEQPTSASLFTRMQGRIIIQEQTMFLQKWTNLKYMGMCVTNQNYILQESKMTLNLGKACYNAIKHNFSSFPSHQVYNSRLKCIEVIMFVTLNWRELGSLVSIVSDYGPDGRGSIPDRGKGFFRYPLRPDWLWSPPSPLHNGYCGLFPQG
jgi:hypothetical protein